MPEKYVEFRIGDAFPPESILANFVARLCIATNDLMLLQSNTEREYERAPGRRGGVPLYYLYATCSHFREAAKRLKTDLEDAEIREFVESLGSEAKERLQRLRDSFTPWEGSFVKGKLYPLRNFTFHYPDASALRQALADAADLRSGIDLGHGAYIETRYDFADELVGKLATQSLGARHDELEATLSAVGALLIDYVYFSHAAVVHFLSQYSKPTVRVHDLP